jgi:phosphoribosyl-ATP pyrophosphohydrolase/phosphoribosyl-AMP cyclohydrolase
MKKIINEINWEKVNNLIPAIIQDFSNNEVLMLGYMNKKSIEKTFETQKVHFFSRTKNRIWMKGEESKNYLNLVNITLDCDVDTLLIKVNPVSPTCHKNTYSCFDDKKFSIKSFIDLFKLIQKRKNELPEKSYTTSLFKDGEKQICAKIEEEALEVIQAIKKETKERLIEESSDLIYHLFVSLVEKGNIF